MTTMNWQQPGDPAWLFEVLKLDGLKGGLEAACGNAGGNYYSDEYGETCFGEDGGYIECGWVLRSAVARHRHVPTVWTRSWPLPR